MSRRTTLEAGGAVHAGRAELGPRLALSPEEAAHALGVSRDYFDLHVVPELRIVRRGRRRLVPIKELERWLDDSASRALERDDAGRLGAQNGRRRGAARPADGVSHREEGR